MTKTTMLIHGAWLNPRGWEHWKARYEAKGFTVLTPDWRSMMASRPNCARIHAKR